MNEITVYKKRKPAHFRLTVANKIHFHGLDVSCKGDYVMLVDIANKLFIDFLWEINQLIRIESL